MRSVLRGSQADRAAATPPASRASRDCAARVKLDHKFLIRLASLLAVPMVLCMASALVDAICVGGCHRYWIASISVSPGASNQPTPSSCPGATPNSVLAPDGSGSAINCYGGLTTLADEHSTIFAPGTLSKCDRTVSPPVGQCDYLFFVATKTNPQTHVSGLTVLTGGSGPTNGKWTLDFAPDFGRYYPNNPPGQQNGQIFLSAMAHDNCPTNQDATFDLNYADPGTVFVDPTNRSDTGSGSVLMIYEGTNRCIGLSGGKNLGNKFYSTIGVATSLDYGHTWPVYSANFTLPLPKVNQSSGPNAPYGDLYDPSSPSVCGYDPVTGTCNPPTSAESAGNWGRYAVLNPPDDIPYILGSLSASLNDQDAGDSEPSAFVDDVSTSTTPYVYVAHTYKPGNTQALPDDPPISPPDNLPYDLAIARAQLNGGTAPLQFSKWYRGSFNQPGVGFNGDTGDEDPIFPVNPSGYANCLAPDQRRSMGSISYVEDTQEYLLTFVCESPSDPPSTSDPLDGHPCPTKGICQKGAAWFYSAIDATRYDLSHVDQWSGSAPLEIQGSWSPFKSTTGCTDFDGWYPSFMSLNRKPGRLSIGGYVFYINGCQNDKALRWFSARTFRIAIQ